MLGLTKAHAVMAGVSLAAFALCYFVQKSVGVKIPVVGPYLPGGQ